MSLFDRTLCKIKMQKREVGEEAIRAALLSQSGAIYNEDDVLRFLTDMNFYKHIGARFLCWMIQLEQLPTTRIKWVSALFDLFTKYGQIRERQDSMKPNLPLRKRRLSERSNTSTDDEAWIAQMLDQMGIQGHYSDDASTRVERISMTICLENSLISYISDFDRCIWISYLVCVFFASRGGLPKIFAEAMAYHMAYSLFSRVNLIQSIHSDELARNHFRKIDDTLEGEAPEVFDLLRHNGTGANDWAIRWELRLFSDEHTAYEVMLIWDQFLARATQINKYIRFLCIAHVKQVPIAAIQNEGVEAIKTFRNWDVAKLVSDATNMMEDEDEENVQCGCLIQLMDGIKRFFS